VRPHISWHSEKEKKWYAKSLQLDFWVYCHRESYCPTTLSLQLTNAFYALGPMHFTWDESRVTRSPTVNLKLSNNTNIFQPKTTCHPLAFIFFSFFELCSSRHI